MEREEGEEMEKERRGNEGAEKTDEGGGQGEECRGAPERKRTGGKERADWVGGRCVVEEINGEEPERVGNREASRERETKRERRGEESR